MKGQKPDEFIRRPMQWTDGANAGFTTGAPWVAINSNYASANVSTLKSDPTSLWNHYRKLIHTRTGSNPLKHGSYEAVSATADNVFAFLRVKDGEAVMDIFNITRLYETKAPLLHQSWISIIINRMKFTWRNSGKRSAVKGDLILRYFQTLRRPKSGCLSSRLKVSRTSILNSSPTHFPLLNSLFQPPEKSQAQRYLQLRAR